nr:hypothetical protein [Clostridia bacterium]
MLAVGGPKADRIKEILEEADDLAVSLTYVRKQGLMLYYEHDAESDDVAKSIVKAYLAGVPEFKNKFITVKACDENGALL